MSVHRRPERPPAPPPRTAAGTGGSEEGLRERWDTTTTALRERFDEPLSRAAELTRRTMGWFPVRVWRRFLRGNGFLLAASISYQSLFSIFAVIYVAFASVGLVMGASTAAINGMIRIINNYLPGLISDDGGLITPDAVAQIARDRSGVLAVTGAVAVLVAVWTSIGFVTYTRRTVRDILRLPYDTRSFLLLKARDFVAAALFGVALVLGAVLATVAVGLLDTILDALHLPYGSFWSAVLGRVLPLLVAVIVNSIALAGLFRMLTGPALPWRHILPGSALGGAAIAVLQVALGLLLSYTPANPLLATFSVLIGFLLWFRLVGVVILVSASWIAVSADDADIPLEVLSPQDQALAEHEARLLVAHLHVREARAAASDASFWHRPAARRALARAEAELARLETSTPPEDIEPGR